MAELEKCFITDIVPNKPNVRMDLIEYSVNYSGIDCNFIFPKNHRNSQKVERNKSILKGLILNDKFPFSKAGIYDNNILEKIIDEAIIPTTPKEKLDELLLFLFEHQDHAGSAINITNELPHDILLSKLFLKSNAEYRFFMKTLQEMGYVSFKETSSRDGFGAIDIRLTFTGLDYIIQLQEEGGKSKNCFIAMWFDVSQKTKRDAIKEVITTCGYKPYVIDELHFDSEITINDAIIQHIKRSKFLIADFTNQRAGVYFEAGYALGRGKPVIYMCSADDFSNIHFDTNHYPHIVYENLTEMKKMLEDKIRAWID